MELQHGLGTRKFDIVNDYEKDINGYAAYLKAFYNDPRLDCWSEGGVLKIKFTPDKQNASLKITSFLNIRTTDEAQKNFSYDGDNTLIIGNVGDIGAYTVTEAKGVRRVLCL